ncbi:MAG: beta-class carbonic anhydrase [Nocardioides sp.]
MGDFETVAGRPPQSKDFETVAGRPPQSKDFETVAGRPPQSKDFETVAGRPPQSKDFNDLIAANAAYAETLDSSGFDGVARAGVAIVTCMDSRIDPLRMLGLAHGDAKIVRNPGGRIDQQALEALVLGVHLLGVDRILVIAHTRCAMTSSSEEQLRERVSESAGTDASWQSFHVIDDQLASLADDVRAVRSHPLIPDTVAVGGFVYDVDTGLLTRHV